MTAVPTRLDTVSARLARFAADISAEAPYSVLQDSQRRVKDVLGISLAARETAPVRAMLAMTTAWGGAPQASVIGHPVTLPAPAAALVNGTMAHALDFDDTHVPSILHPSASIIPAALAAAEEVHSDGRRFLAAIAAGNEIAIRLGMVAYDATINNNIFFDRGFHATSVCGAIGSAAAAAAIYGLDEVGVGHAMGIAASMGSGILEANRAGGSVKRTHCGWAAHAGLVAAQMSAHGISAPASAFEGRFGFFNAYTGIHPLDTSFIDSLGVEWELDNCFMKPYPTNVFTHTGIDAARELSRSGLDADEIERVELAVPRAVMRTIAEPRESKLRPQSGYHAQFSGPYTFAIAYHGGGGLGVYLDDFTDDVLMNAKVQELAAKVHYVEDPRCEEIYPSHFPTVATVRTTDGRTLVAEVLTNLGTVDRPLTETQINEKFALNVTRVSPDLVPALLQALDAVRETADVRSLVYDRSW